MRIFSGFKLNKQSQKLSVEDVLRVKELQREYDLTGIESSPELLASSLVFRNPLAFAEVIEEFSSWTVFHDEVEVLLILKGMMELHYKRGIQESLR